MMKKSAAILALLLMTVLLSAGCGMEAVSSGIEITDNAYFVDKEKGIYTAVLVVENNGETSLKRGYFSAKAFDKDGNAIESVKEPLEDGSQGYNDYNLIVPCNWLCSGEKTALMLTNVLAKYDENSVEESILKNYTSIPESLEWTLDSPEADPDLEPLGLRITACSDYYGDSVYYHEDAGAYTVTVHNDSDNDYAYDAQSMHYKTDKVRFTFQVTAIYRDQEGEIRDAVLMYNTGIGAPMGGIPAGSDTDIILHSDHRCTDESLVPEYYIFIDGLDDL